MLNDISWSKFIAACAASFLLACGGAASSENPSASASTTQEEEVRLPLAEYSPGDPVHGATGVVWPSSLAGIALSDTNQYDLEGYDASGHYRSDEVVISVYIYPWLTDQCQSDVRELAIETSRTFVQRYQGEVDMAGMEVPEALIPGSTNFSVIAVPTADNRSDTTQEGVGIWSVNGWNVKVRVTVARSIDRTPVAYILGAIASMQWPDFTALPSHSLTYEGVYGQPSPCDQNNAI